MERILVYLTELDFYNLMKCSRGIRNIIGISDCWRQFCNKIKTNKSKHFFKLFLTINLSIRHFAIKKYYGKWYYIHILEKWLTNPYLNYWNYSKLISYPEDIQKIIDISNYLLEFGISSKYNELKKLMSKLPKTITKETDMIYFDINNIKNIHICITNTKIISKIQHNMILCYPTQYYILEKPDLIYNIYYVESFHILKNNEKINSTIYDVCMDLNLNPDIILNLYN